MRAEKFNVTLPPAEKRSLAPTMASWRTVYEKIKDLPDTDENLEALGLMLRYEVTNKEGPRSQIMTRLHMRLNAMRQRLEFSKLIRHATR